MMESALWERIQKNTTPFRRSAQRNVRAEDGDTGNFVCQSLQKRERKRGREGVGRGERAHTEGRRERARGGALDGGKKKIETFLFFLSSQGFFATKLFID